MTDPIQTWHAVVRGRVQGVGFRDATVHEARALGLAGWVRNRRDGAVEVLLQGSPAPLQAMVDWLRRGPRLARVDDLALVVQPATERVDGFECRPTA